MSSTQVTFQSVRGITTSLPLLEKILLPGVVIERDSSAGRLFKGAIARDAQGAQFQALLRGSLVGERRCADLNLSLVDVAPQAVEAVVAAVERILSSDDAKYRRLITSSRSFAERFAGERGALEALGFREDADGCLVLDGSEASRRGLEDALPLLRSKTKTEALNGLALESWRRLDPTGWRGCGDLLKCLNEADRASLIRDMTGAGTAGAAFENLRRWGCELGELVAAAVACGPREAFLAGYTAREVLDRWALSDLADCVTASPAPGTVSPADLRRAGVGIADLSGLGFGAAVLRDAGYGLRDMHAVLGDDGILRGGWSAFQFRQAGLPASTARRAGLPLDALRDVGYGLADLKATASWSELRSVGFTDCVAFKRAGCGAGEALAAGFGVSSCVAADFAWSELRDAGVEGRSLRANGFGAAAIVADRTMGLTVHAKTTLKPVRFRAVETRARPRDYFEVGDRVEADRGGGVYASGELTRNRGDDSYEVVFGGVIDIIDAAKIRSAELEERVSGVGSSSDLSRDPDARASFSSRAAVS